MNINLPQDSINSSVTSHEKPSKSRSTPQATKSSEVLKKSLAQNATEEAENYLDENRLIKGKPGDAMIAPEHRDWYLHQALILSQNTKIKKSDKQKLELLTLHGYSKAATISDKHAQELGIQTTPLMREDNRYHRSTRNALLDAVKEAFAKDMGLQPHEVTVIDSPHFKEVINRQWPSSDSLDIDSDAAFEDLIDLLLAKAVKGEFPNDPLLIDISAMLSKEGIKVISDRFQKKVMEKLEVQLKAHPKLDKQKLGDQWLAKIQLIGFTKHKEVNVFLTPEFLIDPQPGFDLGNQCMTRDVRNKSGKITSKLDHMMMSSGYRPSPDQAKAAWLKVATLDTILADQGVPKAELATAGSTVPKVLKNCAELIKTKAFQKFIALSNSESAPYLQIQPKAAAKLIEGLTKINIKGKTIDKVFQEKGLTDILQTSYFRIINAMGEAVLRQDDQVAFNNQIELIHQEIQNIVAIADPYDDKALANSIADRLTEGKNPIVPSDLERPKVHLKASAMHGVSSILAGAERMKEGQSLNIVVLKDSYYESTDILTAAKKHRLSVLDGDKFNQDGIDEALPPLPPGEKVDLFLCEFHHNISLSRTTYQTENIIGQIKAMHKKGLLAKRCTIAIDSTINLEKSIDFRKLLADPIIHQLVKDGQLNITFVRSAQKFDMLGMDNYYGGITTSINKGKAFKAFNERMNAPEDQLRGLSYQGLAHLEKYAAREIEAYRRGIIANTQRLYQKLPKEIIYEEGSANLMQISKIQDRKVVFLDIKFPKHRMVADAFKSALVRYTGEKGLPMTTRSSFGFANTNFTVIDSHKFRLNPGLDDEEHLDQYASFFEQVQECLEKAEAEAKQNPDIKTDKQLDAHIANRLRKMHFS